VRRREQSESARTLDHADGLCVDSDAMMAGIAFAEDRLRAQRSRCCARCGRRRSAAYARLAQPHATPRLRRPRPLSLNNRSTSRDTSGLTQECPSSAS
jgi:hypothetical protein